MFLNVFEVLNYIMVYEIFITISGASLVSWGC